VACRVSDFQGAKVRFFSHNDLGQIKKCIVAAQNLIENLSYNLKNSMKLMVRYDRIIRLEEELDMSLFLLGAR
jgi:hypothetical protein